MRFPIYELRKLKARIRCTMKFNVDNADGLAQGMSENMRKLVKGEKKKDLLRVRTEYNLAAWNNKVPSYSISTLDNKVTGYRLDTRPVGGGWGGGAICMHPLRTCKISKTNTPISPLKNVLIPTASTSYLCWTIVAGNKMFWGMLLSALCSYCCFWDPAKTFFEPMHTQNNTGSICIIQHYISI